MLTAQISSIDQIKNPPKMRIFERRGGCVTNIILLKYNINTIKFYKLITLSKKPLKMSNSIHLKA